MSKKTGLGDNPLNWITDTSKESEKAAKLKGKHGEEAIESPKELQKLKTSEVPNFKTSEVPKFRSFEVKLSILLRKDQLEFLEKLTREIMSNRDSLNKKERITKNTLLRACIDALKGLDIDKRNIPDEKALLGRIKSNIP